MVPPDSDAIAGRLESVLNGRRASSGPNRTVHVDAIRADGMRGDAMLSLVSDYIEPSRNMMEGLVNAYRASGLTVASVEPVVVKNDREPTRLAMFNTWDNHMTVAGQATVGGTYAVEAFLRPEITTSGFRISVSASSLGAGKYRLDAAVYGKDGVVHVLDGGQSVDVVAPPDSPCRRTSNCFILNGGRDVGVVAPGRSA